VTTHVELEGLETVNISDPQMITWGLLKNSYGVSKRWQTKSNYGWI